MSALPEFANSEITHNVEYSIHPLIRKQSLKFNLNNIPLTAKKIIAHEDFHRLGITAENPKTTTLLSKDMILRNSCDVAESGNMFCNAYLDSVKKNQIEFEATILFKKPFAIFECKRVGVEEGARKGPQTIEKAKQGAYVAKTVSSLQKIRFADGKIGGLIQNKDGTFYHKGYYDLLDEVITGNNPDFLKNFIMTVGVVSNHGNWFTSENHNKELKVLAQSYDWLLFLTDSGIAQFIDELLLNPKKELKAARKSFLTSYTGEKGVNQFTKVQLSLDADLALQSYFGSNLTTIEGWFNIISPPKKGLAVLKDELSTLQGKPWSKIHL